MYLQQDLILFSRASFIALSVDHPLSKNFNKQTEFQSFKEKCNKTGTTEEALLTLKNWVSTLKFLLNIHLLKIKKYPFFC